MVGAAYVIVAAEALLATVGQPVTALAVAALLLAPGLALAPLLPKAIRTSGVAILAAAPALGFAASAVALVAISAVGIELTPLVVRALLLAVVSCGLLLPAAPPPLPEGRLALALGGIVALAVVLQARVLGISPAPGNDWAKYVLYASEIDRVGRLLIDNPFWLLGVPFREDPAVPAVYGAFLRLSEAEPSLLMHGIWVFALAGIGSAFALGRCWGPRIALATAALLAAMPISQDILAWHGLANVAALALMPLLLGYLGAFVTGRTDVAAGIGLGLVTVALAATHRLSFALSAAVLLAIMALAIVRRRRAALADLAPAALTAGVLGAGVAADLVVRNRSFGGGLGYEAYVDQKIDFVLLAQDLSWGVAIAGVAAAALAAVWARRDLQLAPVLALLVLALALSVSWIVHVPIAYVRLAYYLPLALAVLIAAVAFGRFRGRGPALAVALLVASAAVAAWIQGPKVQRAYEFANDASLRGIDFLAPRLDPREVVVTDRCWSFMTAWLLQTPTLAAIEDADIQPRAELATVRRAREIVRATPRGRRLARSLGVRYVLTDPTCRAPGGDLLTPPRLGRPVFVSERLVVLRLGGG